MSSHNEIVLKADGLKKSFFTPEKEEIQVIRNVNLEVNKNESLSIRGESGTGKTTLLNILAMLEKPDLGRLYWGDEQVDQKNNRQLAKKRGQLLGLVFQSFYLIPEMNALENVLMARRILARLRSEDISRAKELLSQVGLSKREKQLPLKLSGGECQRVAVARALMNKPKVIIADEPTGNLDEKTGASVMNLLLNMCREEKASLILVTHNPEFAQLTDKKTLLSNGEISYY